jgi:hypothetical protein
MPADLATLCSMVGKPSSTWVPRSFAPHGSSLGAGLVGSLASLVLALGCGDDAGSSSTTTGSTTSPTTVGTAAASEDGPGSTSPAATSTGEIASSGTLGGSTDADTTAGSTGTGEELGDPTVFRTPDEASVCAMTPAAECTPSDMTWVGSEYGSEVQRADSAWADEHGAVYRLAALVERVGPSNIDAFVVDQAGAPLPGIPVAFYYDSLETPSRPDEWYPVKLEAVTDAQGRAGFALGSGAYLPACGAGGPHAVWVSEPGEPPDTTVASDLADRLGMLGGTNHRHLDLLFQRVDAGQAPAAGYCPLGG